MLIFQSIFRYISSYFQECLIFFYHALYKEWYELTFSMFVLNKVAFIHRKHACQDVMVTFLTRML